jgi:hypothetical protein
MCVACTRHQRASTGACASSHSTGRAPPCQAIRDLAHLLGDVDVHRRRRAERVGDDQRGLQFVRRDGAQRMRRHPDGDILGHLGAKATVRLGVQDEPALPVTRGCTPEAAAAIQHRQQCQPDPCLPGRGDDAQRHLGAVGIGRAVRRVVQALGVELGRDRLRVVGRDGGEEAVHHVPPLPEIVAAGPGALGQPRHGALEGVAVEVGDPRHHQAFDPLTGSGARRHGGEGAVGVDVEPHRFQDRPVYPGEVGEVEGHPASPYDILL